MLISCPECRAVYNISADCIPENGKKFKCAECGYIWTVYPSDDKSIEPESEPNISENIDENPIKSDNDALSVETADNTAEDAPTNNIDDDINVMFKRLSHNTKNLFASGNAVEDMSFAEKIRHYALNNFSIYMLSAFLLTTAIILGAKIIQDYRYEIVAEIPMMEKLYARFNAECIYRGKDLKIKDVLIKHINNDGEPFLEVSGKLYNDGKQTVYTVPVKASLLTAEGKVEDEITEILGKHKLEPKFGALFRILLNPPSEEAKKVVISLEDITKQ